jgi:hypothetical protein
MRACHVANLVDAVSLRIGLAAVGFPIREWWLPRVGWTVVCGPVDSGCENPEAIYGTPGGCFGGSAWDESTTYRLPETGGLVYAVCRQPVTFRTG